MASTPKQSSSMDAMIFDAIDHIALCIADSINDLPDEERERKRNELVKTFADGLLIKAKSAENRHQQSAKDSLNVYIAYVKPSRDERKSTLPAQVDPPQKPDVNEEDLIKKFMELKVKSEEMANES
jgi:hypothetical protein